MPHKSLDVTAEGPHALRHALDIIWPAPDALVTHYIIDPAREKRVPSFTLLVNDVEGAKQFEYPLSISQATQFIYGWLEHVDYGEQPDHDGDNVAGWRVTSARHVHIGVRHAVATIQPAWIEYGK